MDSSVSKWLDVMAWGADAGKTQASTATTLGQPFRPAEEPLGVRHWYTFALIILPVSSIYHLSYFCSCNIYCRQHPTSQVLNIVGAALMPGY